MFSIDEENWFGFIIMFLLWNSESKLEVLFGSPSLPTLQK